MSSRGSLRVVAVALALAVVPGVAAAKGFGRSGGRSSSRSSSSSHSSHSFSTSSASHVSHTTVRVVPGMGWGFGRGYYDPVTGMYVSPYYAGWGVYPWGYHSRGYHPYYGAPARSAEQGAASTTSVAAWLGLTLPTSSMPALEGSLRIEGEHWGVVTRSTLLGSTAPDGTVDLMPLITAHLTYSLISEDEARLRFELGATAILAPDFSYIGPDMGLSGQVALFGPLGVYASAHVTPTPARIGDADAGLALQFGGLGLRLGYRVAYLDDRAAHANAADGGVDVIHGPQFAVGLVF